METDIVNKSQHTSASIAGRTDNHMKAIVCTKYGAPEVLQLQEVEKPIPKDNEVLLRVHVATATAASLSGRTGKPFFARFFTGLTKPKKNILGIELAGEVEAVGNVNIR